MYIDRHYICVYACTRAYVRVFFYIQANRPTNLATPLPATCLHLYIYTYIIFLVGEKEVFRSNTKVFVLYKLGFVFQEKTYPIKALRGRDTML